MAGWCAQRAFWRSRCRSARLPLIGSLLWIMAGYALAFGPVSSGWLGGGNGLDARPDLGNVRDGTLVPESAFVAVSA